ncbi:hypothetical protein [Elstera cyanobacteriorum]|uniref:hypothetical protein n=1 Tax=Elstera cyanobacteriorum TaxID=2022747 RepID=UPI0023563644|nr:hypothetical protein [Elstera cyanobacteriorum]MCK6444676.1 hypothetical protein [Elstera cyanobacteriorum]
MRRSLSLLWIALLAVPLATTAWDPLSPPLTENRKIAAPPTLPTDWPTLAAFPAQTSAWLTDHFGLRGLLTVWHNRLKYALFGEYPGADLVRGKDDQIFLNFGKGESWRSLRGICGLDIVDPPMTERIAQMVDYIAEIHAANPTVRLVVIPDKSRVIPEKLPDWLQADCAQSHPPMPDILAKAAARLGKDRPILYPLTEFRAATPYPAANFHWTVAGAWPIAQLIAETHLGIARRTNPTLRPFNSFSDLTSFMPGLSRPITETEPDWSGTGMLSCRDRPECFPEFPEIAERLIQVSRFWPAAPKADTERRPRLLLLSDSFGTGIAPGLAPYFSDLWHISLNEGKRLSAAQRATLRQIAVEAFNPDIILLLFSEGGMVAESNSLRAARRLLAEAP